MPERSALVLYGSETGTAQDGAEEVSRMLMRLHFAVRISALDEIEPAVLTQYAVVVCAISTTGQGDIPENAKVFWKKILRAKLTSSFFAAVRCAVFGFGDSSYPKYNYAALKLQKRLLQLGAYPIIPMGKGDEQHPEGHEASFLPWMLELRKQLLKILPLPPGTEVIPDDVLLEPTWLLSRIPSHKNKDSYAYTPLAARRPQVTKSSQDIEVILEKNDRVTPDSHWQDVRHITFEPSIPILYAPGDVLFVYPHNPADDVQELIELMHWQEEADKPIEFSRNEKALHGQDYQPPSFSTASATLPETLRDLLTQYLDINSIPRRSFFSLIAHFTEDEYQKNRLLEFSNTEYLDELYDYTTRPRRSILEVLQEFDTVKIPLQWAAVIFPVLRGRQFSIASSHDISLVTRRPVKIELLVAIVKYRTVIRKIRQGVCSRYLDILRPGSKLSVTIQKGSLGVIDHTQPAILIGPGTGIAPVRSLLWQRVARSRTTGIPAGGTALFFGCRNKSADFFFQDELQSFSTMMPFQLFPAFSRDQDQKQYVQDLIKQNSQAVYEICQQNGLIFVCGSSGKMPVAVRSAIKEAIATEASMSDPEAESYLAAMEKTERYKQETW